LVKGRALARPSERSERFEAVVRPGLPDTVAAATQKEKADAAKLEGERGKLFVTVPSIKPTPFDNATNYATCWRRDVTGVNQPDRNFGACLTFG
jgi:hypothetical protein